MTGRRAVLAVFAAAAVLYVLSAAPGVLWGDSAKLAVMARSLEVKTNPGGHPGYVLLVGGLVRTVPIDAARLLNLVSALSGAVAVAMTFAVGRRLGGPWAGVVAASALAVAHVPWLAASIAETYAPALAALAVGVYALLRWREEEGGPAGVRWAALAGLAFGLGGAINAVVLLAAPGLVLPLLPRLRGWPARGAFAAAGLVGLAPYWAVAFLRGAPAALGGGVAFEMAAYFGRAGWLRELIRMPAYLAYQLPSPAVVLAPVGVVILWRRGDRDVAAALVLAAMIVGAFAAVWLRQRQFLILSAAVLMLAALAGAGAPVVAAWVAERWGVGRRTVLAALLAATLVLPPVAYVMTPPVARAVGIDLVGARELPHREATSYYLRPWKGGYGGTERYVEEAAAILRPGDVVYADFTVERPLLYGLAGTADGDVDVREMDRFIFAGDPSGFVDEVERAMAGGRRVYLADDHPSYYFVEALSERFELRADGVLVRVAPDGPGR